VSTPDAQALEGRRAALPGWLRPRDVEAAGGGRTWRVETILLVLVALLLATATVNDVVRQRGVNERLIADLRTWRAYTGHDYLNLTISQELLGPTSSQREVVCGNTTPGAPKANIQICLAIWGPVAGARRTVHGGWYLPAKSDDDTRRLRYGCFGPASRGICPR
jgi:hypothetical protein